MKSYIAREDVEHWVPLVEWLEKPKARIEDTGSIAPAAAVGG
jgi:hypothetical protein